MKYAAVLFDLDGTLLDTLEDLADSMNRTLKRHGLPEHPVDAYRYFVGDGARNLTIRALPEEERTEPTIHKLLSEFRADYGENWRVKTRPYPGIPAMLDALQAKGIKLAVVSNKPDADTRRCVESLLPHCRFDHILGQREGVPLKPDPTAALEVTRKLKVAPPACLFLGDTRMDIETALAAGMFPVGALWGFRTRKELEDAGAKALVAKPMDVVKLVE